jgi:hypothetical protein
MAGFSAAYPVYRACLWVAGLSVADLNIALPAMGADLTGWTLTYANAISADGRTLVGNGLHNGRREAWIAHLPPRCVADFNGDAVANVQDFLAYLQAFAAADPRADTNADGFTNIQDFLLFLSSFAAGCP